MADAVEKQRRSGSGFLGSFIGALVGAAAAVAAGVLTTVAAHDSSAAQAQLQIETLRRAAYADFVTATANACLALNTKPFDLAQANAALGALYGKESTILMVAPDDVYNTAHAAAGYILADAAGPANAAGTLPVGCDNDKYFDFINKFLKMAKDEMSWG